jgi:hypothetical protein
MATGLSSYLANKFLDAVANAVSYSAANVYIKLHTGEPGANGTANAATETTRQEATLQVLQADQSHPMPPSLGQTLRVLRMLLFSLLGIMLLLAISYLVVLSLAMLMLQVILIQSKAAL